MRKESVLVPELQNESSCQADALLHSLSSFLVAFFASLITAPAGSPDSSEGLGTRTSSV